MELDALVEWFLADMPGASQHPPGGRTVVVVFVVVS